MTSAAIQIIHEGQEDESELGELGLSLEILSGALSTGLLQRLNSSATEPSTMPGTHLWAGTTKGLRELLSEKGWQYVPNKGRPMLLSPDGCFQVTLLSGDAHTGVIEMSPSNRSRKGPTLQEICLRNSGGDLFSGMFVDGLSADSPKTWVLLYHFAPSPEGGFSLCAELSLPIKFHKGFIVEWERRILLPPIQPSNISLSVEQLKQAERFEIPEIEIQRKAPQ